LKSYISAMEEAKLHSLIQPIKQGCWQILVHSSLWH